MLAQRRAGSLSSRHLEASVDALARMITVLFVATAPGAAEAHRRDDGLARVSGPLLPKGEQLMSAKGQKRAFGPQKLMSAYPRKRTYAVQNGMSALPIADICRAYSITSSAAFSSPYGTVRPNV